MQSSKKRQRKKKSLQRYRALSDNRMENKVFVSKNDRSKWPARLEFDRSSPRSGRTLSVDRPLFAALCIKLALLKFPLLKDPCSTFCVHKCYSIGGVFFWNNPENVCNKKNKSKNENQEKWKYIFVNNVYIKKLKRRKRNLYFLCCFGVW